MVEFCLTEEQLLLQRTACGFAEKQIRPVAEQIEKMDHNDPAAWDLTKGLLKKAKDLGFLTMYIPEEYGGGGGVGPVDGCIFSEEMGAVDLGLAMTLGATMGYPMFIMMAGTEEQRRKWLTEICTSDEVIILAGAQSEANVAGSELFCPYPDPKLGLKTYAKKEGDEYVINGSKSAFITNAPIAKYCFLVCRTDMTKPPAESMSFFYVPTDAPGFSTGKRTECMGMRTGFHSEIFLDNVRVPKECLLGREGDALRIMTRGLGGGSTYVGLARAAYQYALNYAKERYSWGQPLTKHQAVALMLADMEIEIQAARLLCWEAAWDGFTNRERANPIKGIAAKVYAVDVATKTAQNAVKILGAYGITKEYKAEKFLRDAWMGYACDFTGDLLRLRIAELL